MKLIDSEDGAPAWVRAVSATALVSAAWALAAELAVLPEPWFDWSPTFGEGAPESLMAVVALALVVAAAPWAYLVFPALLRAGVMALAVTAAAVVMVELPAAFDRSEPAVACPQKAEAAPSCGETSSSFGWWLRAPLAGGLAVLLGKLVLLHRFAGLERSQVRRDAQVETDRLLTYQRDTMERLWKAVSETKLTDDAHVVQLAGRWGDGKSFLVHRLGRYLRSSAVESAGEAGLRADVAIVDTWKHESEPGLHLAILEELLRNRRYLYPYGWLRYPLTLLVGRSVRQVRMQLSLKAVATEMNYVPPRLPWQRPLEQLVARHRKRGRRTVIVLDEIDRATPEVAQSALTLMRRSLDLAGVSVVVCYVDPLIRYKVFNPLLDRVLPDLGSTMEAVIFEEAFERGGSERRDDTTLGSVKGDSVEQWWAWQRRDGADAGTSGLDLSSALRRGYAGASHGTRRRLQQRFAERYLGTRLVRVGVLGPDDLADMLGKFDELKPVVKRLAGDADVGPAVKEALTGWSGRRGAESYEPPPIRPLAGRLFEILTELKAELSLTSLGTAPPELVAAAVTAAYDATALEHTFRLHSEEES